MAKLTYIANVSLDSFIEDQHGNIDWSAPGDDVFTFMTDLVRSAGTYLYGRRMYETMAVWRRTLAWPASRSSYRLRERLVGGRQGRLLHHPGSCVHRQDSARAHLRPRLGPRHEGIGRQ